MNAPDATPIWLELAAKYDVPAFGAAPAPLPTFATTVVTKAAKAKAARK